MHRSRLRSAAALIVISTACGSAAAQSLFAQYGEVLLAANDPVPGLAGATVFSTGSAGIDTPYLDQNGTVIARIRMQGTVSGIDDRAYVMGRGKGDLRVIVRANDPAPGIPGATLRSSSATGSSGLPSTVRISPFNELIFFASSIYDEVTPANTPTSSDTALFWGPPAGLVLLAREGTEVPFYGPGSGVKWGQMTTNFSTQYSHINAGGQVVAQSILELSGPVTAANDALLWTGVPNGLSVISREGDVLPGGEVVMPASGSTMSFIVHINEVGHVVHEMRFATTAPSTATTANDRALAVWTGGTNVIVAREGDQVPSLPAGVLYGTSTQGWSPSVGGFTRSGKILLFTSLAGNVSTTDDSALLIGGIGGWTTIAREGDAAPGIPGATISGFTTTGSDVNDAGQVAAIAFLAGTPGGATDDSCLMFGTAGNLQIIAREGDPVVASGLSLTGYSYGGINAGTSSPRINDRGVVHWQASVDNGTDFRTIMLSWDAVRGMQCLLDGSETITTLMGTASPTSVSNQGTFVSSDGGSTWFNNSGDWAGKFNFPSNTLQGALVRGHAGNLHAATASIDAVLGGTQSFGIDVGATFGNSLYVVLGSTAGTRPGFLSPLGPQTIPLNFDAWTQLSLDLANSVVYPNSLWFTDAAGKSTAAFFLPPNVPGLQGLNLHHAAVVLDFFTVTSTFVTEPVALKLY
jgi:hypothetical protein